MTKPATRTSRLRHGVFGLALIAAASVATGTARADDDGGPSLPSTDEGKEGEGPKPPTNDSVEKAPISEDARRHFRAGVALLQDPEGEKVEEAYREFRAAFDLSGSPKILGNMGFCAMRLERDGEAIDAYSRYLREVPDIDPEERAQIVRDLQTLQVGIVRLTLEVDKPGVRILDERIPVRGARVTNAYGPVSDKVEIGVRPGHHVITARLPGHEPAVWELEAYAGSRDRHVYTMRETPRAPAPAVAAAPAPAAESGSSGPGPGPFVLMGGGAALLVAGTVTGVIALGKASDIETRCPNDLCPRTFDLDGERASAKTFVRVTDVLLLVGGLATLAGAGWLLFGGGGERDASKAARFGSPLRVSF